MMYFILGLSVVPIIILLCFFLFRLALWLYEKDAIRNGATNASG